MIDFAVYSFMSLITLLNPIGIVPTFLSLTDGDTQEKRRRIALKTSATVFITIVIFAALGDFIFNFFGITLEGLRIVGGIVLMRMGFDLLQGHSAQMKQSNINTDSEKIAITPLGFPIVCGAGTITAAIVVSSEANTSGELFGFLAGAFVCCVTIFIVFASATRVTNALGDNGRSIMNRVMGLILMMIAIEFFFTGLKPFLIEVVSAGLK